MPLLATLGMVAACGSSDTHRGPPKPWKGAEMITRQAFRYGAFEARICSARGSGIVTPFFLFKDGAEAPGAEWEELDFEIFGKDGTYQTQAMTPGEGGRVEHAVIHQLPTLAWERYYTYRLEWTPTRLSFFVDGQLVREETDAVEFAKLMDPARAEPMRLRISVWAGDYAWPGVFDPGAVPAAMFVNWIQAFAYAPGLGPDGGDFELLWRDELDHQDGDRWYWASWTFELAVNDYIRANSGVADGYLIQVLTSDTGTGRFPIPPLDDGTSAPPVGL